MIAGAAIRVSDADVLSAWEAGAEASPVERAVAVAAYAAPPGEAVGEWTIGQRDGLLLDLQAAAFGREIELVTSCPACDEALELAFDAAEVHSAFGEAGVEHELEDPAGGVRLAFRLPSSADLLAVVGLADVDAARRALAERCIVRAERDGGPVAAREVPETALDALAARAAELDPQADLELALACAECGHRWSTRFDVADHVWRSLDVRAHALMGEVAALGAAFGWTEAEVLRLPRGRRRRYLELAGA
jgi:hypothetical protein